MKKLRCLVLGVGHPWFFIKNIKILPHLGPIDVIGLTRAPKVFQEWVKLNTNKVGNWAKVRLVAEVIESGRTGKKVPKQIRWMSGFVAPGITQGTPHAVRTSGKKSRLPAVCGMAAPRRGWATVHGIDRCQRCVRIVEKGP